MSNTGSSLYYKLVVTKSLDDVIQTVTEFNMLDAFVATGTTYSGITTNQLALYTNAEYNTRYAGLVKYINDNYYSGFEYSELPVGIVYDSTCVPTTTTTTTPPTTTTTTTAICYVVETIAATPPTNPELGVAVAFNTYSMYGTLLFESGYNINGTGTYSRPYTGNAFWNNVGQTLIDGPLNRTGIWSTTSLDDQTITFSACFTVATAKTYYVGLACDNRSRLTLNGTVIVDQEISALQTQAQALGGVPDTYDTRVPFTYWYIYPVALLAGDNIIEITGVNGPFTSGGNPAAIGAEIYDNTPSEILDAVDYTTLDVVFTTADFVGLYIQGGSDGIGYSCPSGYALSCGEVPVCTRTVVGPCTTTTTTTVPVTTTTTTVP